MNLIPLPVDGAYVIEPVPVKDRRGWFVRLWDAEELERLGLRGRFVQQSAARNERAGTVRGMHVALPPAAEIKIVRCTRGAAFDVVADVRPSSPTFGRHAVIELDASAPRCVYIPAGCAHGYQTVEDGTELMYDISEAYRPELASGVAYDDPTLAIRWPLPLTSLSERDRALPRLETTIADALARR